MSQSTQMGRKGRGFVSITLFAFGIAQPAPAEMIEVSQPEASAERPVVVLAPSITREAIASGAISFVGGETYVAVDLLAGLLTGVRVRIPTFPFGERARVVLEGMYGGVVSEAGIGTMVGGGVRVQINVAQDRDGNDALMISPGIDVIALWDETPDTGWIDFGPDSTVYLLSGNVDISWVHEFSRHFGLELGARLGGSVGLSGLTSGGEPAAGTFSPELSVFVGLRF